MLSDQYYQLLKLYLTQRKFRIKRTERYTSWCVTGEYPETDFVFAFHQRCTNDIR